MRLTKEIKSIIEDHTTALFALQRDIGAVRLEYPMPDPAPDPKKSLGAFMAAMKMVSSSEDLTEAIPAPRQVRADDTIDEGILGRARPFYLKSFAGASAKPISASCSQPPWTC